MIPWLTILKGLLSLASSIAGYLHDKQLIDAGRSQAIAEGATNALEQVKKAQAARLAVNNSPDSLRADPRNRDIK